MKVEIGTRQQEFIDGGNVVGGGRMESFRQAMSEGRI